MSLQPHQIRAVLKSQMNRSLIDFGRRDFTREELVALASAEEGLLEDALIEWELAGFLSRKNEGSFYIRLLRPIEIEVPGWSSYVK